MTTTVNLITVGMAVRANAFSLAWLNVFSTTGQSEANPRLYRTLALEFFRGRAPLPGKDGTAGGVQLVATDGHALFRAWVPAVPGEDEVLSPWPEVEEAPDRAIVVMDPDGFGVAFMRALYALTKDDAHAFDTLQLGLASNPEWDPEQPALGASVAPLVLSLRAGAQRTDLRLFEDEYPAWRQLKLGDDEVERLDGLTLNPRLLARVGQLKTVTQVDLAFTGDETKVAFHAKGDVDLKGLIMPMRRTRDAEDE